MGRRSMSIQGEAKIYAGYSPKHVSSPDRHVRLASKQCGRSLQKTDHLFDEAAYQELQRCVGGPSNGNARCVAANVICPRGSPVHPQCREKKNKHVQPKELLLCLRGIRLFKFSSARVQWDGRSLPVFSVGDRTPSAPNVTFSTQHSGSQHNTTSHSTASSRSGIKQQHNATLLRQEREGCLAGV
jgi:hypothetical protein|mmetsp:Transcript_32971/g.55147  ORF Transcript_32971/g.55147 Transcript_32971/m.55147 type:complete len:185 (+) Transcript_32971:1438-1992(+)